MLNPVIERAIFRLRKSWPKPALAFLCFPALQMLKLIMFPNRFQPFSDHDFFLPLKGFALISGFSE
jgi:hypothetical protein